MRKINKVMLIFPPGKVLRGHFHHCEVPMGLAYLASAIRSDFDVKVLDGRAKFQRILPPKSKWEYFGFTQQEIAEQVLQYSPDVVGISCISSFHFPDVASLCALIKQKSKNIITVIGGAHPTFLAEDVMSKHPEIDFIVMGEGERTFYELLCALKSGQDYRALDGLSFRNNGSFCVNHKKNFINDLDILPYPAFELFPLDFYEKKSVPFSITFRSKKSIPMVTSRGCSAQCVFCASRNYWGRMYRARSATNVLNEIEFLLDKFGFEEIQFIDDNLTFDKKRSKEIFRGIIDRRLKIHWNTPNGIAIWTLDEEMLELMKESGCYELTIAFESGVQEVVDKIIKKPINLKKAQVLVKKIKKMGIFVNAFFISGFPGETKQQILETFAFAERMDLDSAYFFAANPTPGSELYEICRKKGYLKDGFMFDEIEYNLPNIKTEEFSPRDVEKLILKQFNLFYMKQMIRHPVRFFNKFFNMFISHPVMSIRTFLADIKRIFIK